VDPSYNLDDLLGASRPRPPEPQATNTELATLLKEIFPLGVWRDRGNRPKVFAIGPLHIIAPRRVEGGIDVTWAINASPQHLRINDAWMEGADVPQDTYEIRTYNDLVGWVSWVREEILTTTANALAGWIKPSDLYPDGIPRVIERALPLVHTIPVVGLSTPEFVRRVALILMPEIQWKLSKKGAPYFEVHAAGTGVVTCRHNGTSVSIAMQIPVTGKEAINLKFDMETPVDPPVPPAASARTLAVEQYVTATLNFILDQLKQRQVRFTSDDELADLLR
jgi:hypothetical protein